jgi:predicted exporter
MTNLITKLTTALSNTVLFTGAIVMVGVGFAAVGTLALFALVAVGVAMLTAPFVTPDRPAAATADVEAETVA